MYKLILTRKVYQTTKKNTTCFPVTWFYKARSFVGRRLVPDVTISAKFEP